MDEKRNDSPPHIIALTQQHSAKALIEHHRLMLQEARAGNLAHELLTLTQSHNWQVAPAQFISHGNNRENGNNDFANARALGIWLGSLQSVISEQAFSSSEASEWFSLLLAELKQLPTLRDLSAYSAIERDIASDNITLNEALELLAFGDITSSSVTTVIGQGIRSIRRNR